MAKRLRDALYPNRKDKGYVFESDRAAEHKSRYRFDCTKTLRAALAAAGLSEKDPWQRLRHTFGSLHVWANVPILTVSRWMGHSSVTVTEKHYAGTKGYDPKIDSF